MRADPLLETTGEPGQYIAMPAPNWLHLTPGHLSEEIGRMADAFTYVKFPLDVVTADICRDDSTFKVWYIPAHDKDYWKDHYWWKIKQYKEGVYAWHELYAGMNGYTMKAFLDMSNVIWQKYSLWRESKDAPGVYYRVMTDAKTMMNLPTWTLILEVRRENPHWYKLHPCPNLQEDRMSINQEKFACDIYWWIKHVRELKPATFAYIRKFIDDKAHCRGMPKFALINLMSLISHRLTNFCRQPLRRNLDKSELLQVPVYKGQTLTRPDGYEDITY